MDEEQQSVPRVMMAQAERLGDKPFIAFAHDTTRIVTYGGMVEIAQRAGARLARDYGLEPGAVAMVFLPNGPDFVHAWSSSLFAGLVDIPVNYEFRRTMLFYALNTVGAQLAITDQDGFARLLEPEVRPYLPRLRLIVRVDDTDLDEATRLLRDAGGLARVIGFDELRAPGAGAGVWERIEGMSLASIRYTSGTTGSAKGIMYCHLHLLNRTHTHAQVMTMQHDDTLYSPFPLYHGLTGTMGALGVLQTGATLVGRARFSASQFWRDIGAHKATLGHILFSLVPMILAQPPAAHDRDHAVRYLYTAWPHPEFEQRFNTKFLQIYAQSEVGVMAYRRAGTEQGSRNVGKPLEHYEIRIVDALDRFLPAGAVGEIVLRPRAPQQIMLGYFNNLTATARAFRNLWHHTGDAGYLTDAGELFFIGRIGDTIRRRGVNISSEQIEDEVLRHPNVAECAVVGVPSVLGEEDIHVCVRWRQPPESTQPAMAEFLDFLAARLPRQYLPRYVEPTGDLPRTETGKVRKTELKQRAQWGRTWDSEAGVWLEERAQA